MEAYTYLAKYYDILMKDFDYEAYLKFIRPFIHDKGVDLCCGSGTMTINMANNCSIIGVDISNEMLNEARNKAKKASKNILFINSDVANFTPPSKVDFVTCVCDGFNYIKTNKLLKVFDTIASYLKQGGYFIFDISTKYKLQSILANNVFCEDLDNVTYIWSNKINKDSLKMNLSFFVEQKDRLYIRLDEEHTQYMHEHEILVQKLAENFNVEVFDGHTFKEYTNKSNRALYVLKRI